MPIPPVPKGAGNALAFRDSVRAHPQSTPVTDSLHFPSPPVGASTLNADVERSSRGLPPLPRLVLQPRGAPWPCTTLGVGDGKTPNGLLGGKAAWRTPLCVLSTALPSAPLNSNSALSGRGTAGTAHGHLLARLVSPPL